MRVLQWAGYPLFQYPLCGNQYVGCINQAIPGIPILANTPELSAIDKSHIKDGMVADGRIFCCAGPNESDYPAWFYVPEGSDASVGDIVEVKMGAIVLKGEPLRAPVNTFQRVRSKLEQEGKECRWMPDNPLLYLVTGG